MKRTALLLALLALSGCSVVTGKRGDVTVRSYRCLWKSEAIQFAVADTNFSAVLTIGKSGTDGEALRLATEAAIKAALQSLRPLP